jgi:hypothetical protein
MIDKCSCGATCSQVEALQAEIESLKSEIWDLRHQMFLLIGEEE